MMLVASRSLFLRSDARSAAICSSHQCDKLNCLSQPLRIAGSLPLLEKATNPPTAPQAERVGAFLSYLVDLTSDV